MNLCDMNGIGQALKCMQVVHDSHVMSNINKKQTKR